MPPRYRVGLDIGGTSIKAGLVDAKARIVCRAEEANINKGPRQAKEQLIGIVRAVLPEKKSMVRGIGIGAPGPLDIQKGLLMRCPNIPGWKNVPIVSWIRQAFRLPCRMDNDANAAALAESLWGAGKGYRHVFYATLSTGIGTGLVIDKRLYVGRSGRALEGGHLSIDYQGRQCNCGLKGCIEAYASGPSMVRRAAGYLHGIEKPVTPKTILKAARAGDKKAARFIKETGELLGVWLGNIVNILEPDVIILGGGVSNLGDPLFGPIKKTLPRHCIIPYANTIPVVRAHFESDSGILGAAAIADCGR